MRRFCDSFATVLRRFGNVSNITQFPPFSSVIMGMILGYGICSLLGLFYSAAHTVIPFILLGIGIDNIFVITQTFKTLGKFVKKDQSQLYFNQTDDFQKSSSIRRIFRLQRYTANLSECSILISKANYEKRFLVFFFLKFLLFLAPTNLHIAPQPHTDE